MQVANLTTQPPPPQQQQQQHGQGQQLEASLDECILLLCCSS
jgi:hypothetical protein